MTKPKERTCMICGCTESRACEAGCSWVNDQDDICTECVWPPARQPAGRPRHG